MSEHTLEELMVEHCAPVMAGIKTANMFTGHFTDHGELIEKTRLINRRLRDKGLMALPLKYSGNTGIIYICRPDMLAADLNNSGAVEILEKSGYHRGSTNVYLDQLIRRMKDGETFPHEVGIFLGYPPEDVDGFIRNRSRGCKCIGAWKVYGDENKARQRFQMFSRCRNIYGRCFRNGTTIEQLTVAM